MKLEFSRQISEYPQISNVVKIPLKGAELFHAGGRSDGQKDRQTADRQTGRYEEAVSVRWRSYYTHNCETYSEFPVILVDGLRESEALREHQKFSGSSLYPSFTEATYFLYNLILFDSRSMFTSSLPTNYIFFFLSFFFYFESYLHFYPLTLQHLSL